MLFYPKDTSRKSYLQYLTDSSVATPEEQDEYRQMHRQQVQNIWNKFKEQKDSELEKQISFNSKQAIKLRSVGLLNMLLSMKNLLLN